MGLSWHRAARSISIGAWLKKLDAERVALEQLPRSHDLKSAPAYSRPGAPSFRATALFVVLLIMATLGVLIARLPPKGQSGTDSVARAKDAAVAGNPVAASMAVKAAPQEAAASNAPPLAQPPPSPDASEMRRDVNPSKPPTGLTSSIVATPRSYKIRSGEHYAEIRVHRSTRSGNGTPFVWWTEPASAKPGVDYVAQEKVTQSFPKGENSTSFFVKLVPNAPRAQPEVFYIAIASARGSSSSGHVTRAAVWLPPNDDHSAAVAAEYETGVPDPGTANSIEPASRPINAD
jgi:hypothetical protein